MSATDVTIPEPSIGRRTLWVDADWEHLDGTLALIDEFARAVRPRDGIELMIATNALTEAEAAGRLMARLGEIPGLAARQGHLAEISVGEGLPPAGAEVLDGRDETAVRDGVAELRRLRVQLSQFSAVTPVLDRAEWIANWRPEPGFHPLIVDNVSTDGTAELARAAGADIVIQPERVGRVANWMSAADHFLRRTDAPWLKWHFAGDELLPGAADVLQDAAEAHPEARLIIGEYLIRYPDGTLGHWRQLEHTRLIEPEEALERSARSGNWFGSPIAHAVHRDAIAALEFGSQPWVADWQACLSIAATHPVLYVAEPVGVFDVASRQFFGAHEQAVYSLVQELSLRQQSVARLRERAPQRAGLDELAQTVDTHAATTLAERVSVGAQRIEVVGERGPSAPARPARGDHAPVIAVHAPRVIDGTGRDINGYGPEFAARYARYAYLPQLDRHPELIARRRRGEPVVGPSGLEIITDPRELDRVADILVCFEGRPYLPELAPPRAFGGLKAYHGMDFVFYAQQANQALVEGGVDLMLGYCRHDEHSPFFRAMYPSFQGRTHAVPFGFGPRFVATVPFHERDSRVIGLGSVNPVDDPLCPPGELDAYVAFHPGVQWTHAWRRALLENAEELDDVLDARFPVFPETKDFSYDAVAALNGCMMYANDPGLMAFPPARTYEGAACGAVLVGEDSDVHRELGFVHGQSALLHRAGDVEDFARVVREARAEPGQLASIAAAGHRLVTERYTHDAVARTLHEQLCAVHAGQAL